MNIAFLLEIFYPEINGIMTATFDLAENLKKKGHHVFYIVPRTKEYGAKQTGSGIEVFQIGSVGTYIYRGIRYVPPFSHRLHKKFLREKVDILHITAPSFLAMGAIKEARCLGIPVVQTYHTLISEPTYYQYFFFGSVHFPFAKPLVLTWINYFNKRCQLLTAPSQHVIEQFKGDFPKSPILYLSNGIDVEVFDKHDSFEKLQSDYPGFNHKTFVYVGRLGKEKSVEVLIKAMKFVSEKDQEVRLFVIGQGPYAEELKKLTLALGLTRKVFFTGKIEHRDMIRKGFLQFARGFVTASKTDNQPMTILEATACCTPLILPREKGIKELLAGNGIFFEADNTKELSEAILTIADDDEAYQKYQKNSQKLKEKYDGRNVADLFVKLYKKILGQSYKTIAN